MPHKHFDRSRVQMRPLAERKNRVVFERDRIDPDTPPEPLNEQVQAVVQETVERIRLAKDSGRPRMLAFGAHTIKNALSPILMRLIEGGWVTHLATNGAGIIHDWEFAYLGETSEDVRANVADGTFGAWEETGRYLNLALAVGAYSGLGYGESVGAMVEEEQIIIPSIEELREAVLASLEKEPELAASGADLLGLVQTFSVEPGTLQIPHPFKHAGLQAAAYRLSVPYTGHPMIGHDVHYIHPMNHCAAIGRTAQRDFLRFAQGVSELSGGVYLSIGSAVMSPMVFEKSMAMAQNVALQEGRKIEDHFLVVVDLARSGWDWTTGEPPEDNPDYYLRYNKTFSRMGGTMRYVSADNKNFLLALLHKLEDA